MDELAHETPVVISPYGPDIFIMCGVLKFETIRCSLNLNVAVLDNILGLDVHSLSRLYPPLAIVRYF